jgi:disulfide bond formation protein DsbB
MLNQDHPIAPHRNGLHATFWTPLFLAWLLALLATAGAIFLGEVMGMTPCVLCWYQRIAMFPLVLVLGVGLFAADASSARYALPLAGVGWATAAYHLLIFWGLVSEGLVPCGKGSSCADVDVQVAGAVPIPLLSLVAFSGILAALWVARRRARA